MKQLLSSLLLLLVCLTASAFTYTYEGQTLTYTSSGGTCYVAANNNVSGDLIIPETAMDGRYAYTVTSIGKNAFKDCSGLTSVSIPNSVTSIGESAFQGCSRLASVSIPSSVTSIGSYAFDGCSWLASVSIPSSVTTIEPWTFSGSGLRYVVIPSSVTSIEDGAFNGCSWLASVSIPSSVTSIEPWTFCGCSSLTSVAIPSSVTSIGESAFRDCSGLTSVPIPNSVTSIDHYAFRGCSGLTSVTIPSSVTYIGWGVFQGCSSLTSAIIPNSVTTIEPYTFWRCSSLKDVTIGSKVETINEGAFWSCPLETIKVLSLQAPKVTNAFDESTYSNATLIYNLGADVDASYADRSNVWWKFGNYRQEDLTIPSIALQPSASIRRLEIFQLNTIVYNVDNPVLEWSSLNPDVVIVDDNGKILGATAGETDICVTVQGHPEAKATCHVTVRNEEVSTIYGDFDEINHTITINGFIAYAPTYIGIPETAVVDGQEYTVTAIAAGAFSDNTLLEMIWIPSTVTSIERGAFYGCTGLHTVFYNPVDAAINYVVDPFYFQYNDGPFAGCTALRDIVIGETVNRIPRGLFAYTAIEVIDIPDNVETLDACAFFNCTNLKEIHIGTGLKDIVGGCFALEEGVSSPATKLYFNARNLRAYTFVGREEGFLDTCWPFSNRNLTEITFGDEVESLPVDAFSECDKLTDIYCITTTPPVLGTYCFTSTDKSSCTLHVPDGAQEAYQSAYIWEQFFNSSGIDAPTVPDLSDINSDMPVDIYNTLGHKVYSGMLEDASLEQGIYIVRQGSAVKKIMKK